MGGGCAQSFSMKILLLIILSVLAGITCFGQTKKVPANLSQAIKFLDSDCPDSLKRRIKMTPNNDLKKLGYPWGGQYKTVFEWTKRDSNSKLEKYLSDRGVSAHQDIVIFLAFKKYLLEQTINETTLLKPYQEIEKQWNYEDKVRYTTDSLRGVYIPKDLEDCFKQIDSFWNDSTKLKVKHWTEDEFSARVHLGFGMWLRNNWQLWGGSRLSKYFNEMGITHSDDMSGIILDSYHRHLNNNEIKLEEQVQHYRDYWEKVKMEELKRKQEEFSEYSVGDTVLFKYNFGYSTFEQEEKYNNDSCLAKGKVVGLNKESFQLTVSLIESCDKKGIVYSDNENTQIFNPKTKRWEKPKKRVIKYMKTGQVKTFDYGQWDTL
jgi:hypothetical protein